MKEEFIKPQLEITLFEPEDTIRTSTSEEYTLPEIIV